MLEIIRKASRTWVAKIFLVVLFVPFIVWGVSDAFFSFSGKSTVVSVGNQKIPLSVFTQIWTQELDSLSRQIGFTVPPERARSAELDKKITEHLVAGAALDQFIEDTGLEAPDSRVFEFIRFQPIFYGKDGKFSHEVFVSKLAQEGVSEKEYVETYKKMISRSDIAEMFIGGDKSSRFLAEQMMRHYSENRTIEYVVLNAHDVPAVVDPASVVLAEWFAKFKGNYRAPEYKSFSYIALDVNEKEKNVVVAESELRSEYEKNKNQYFSPEIRTVEQLVFPNKKEAEKALQSLKKGKKFVQLAQEQGKSLSDISLGSFSKEYIPDPSLADPIFSLAKEGDYTSLIHGSFGYVIAHVSRIKPSFTTPFEQLKKSIEHKVRLAKASQVVLEEYKKAQDLLSSGKTMKDIATKEKFSFGDLPPLNYLGMDMKNRPVQKIPYKDHLLSRIFNQEGALVTDTDNTIHLPDGSYVIFKVKEVIPARDRKLEEVLTEVKKDWKSIQQTEAVLNKAQNLVLACNKGKSFADMASSLRKFISVKSNITRMAKESEEGILENDGILRVFSGPVGMVKSFPIKNGAEQVVFKVVHSKINPMDDKKKFILSLEKMIGKDMLDSSIAYLRQQYPVYVNESLITKYFDQHK